MQYVPQVGSRRLERLNFMQLLRTIVAQYGALSLSQNGTSCRGRSFQVGCNDEHLGFDVDLSHTYWSSRSDQFHAASSSLSQGGTYYLAVAEIWSPIEN